MEMYMNKKVHQHQYVAGWEFLAQFLFASKVSNKAHLLE